MDNYSDIINLPRPFSKRPRMAQADRAAQFSPFAALTGYDAAVKETARLTDEKIELDENEKAILNEKLCIIAEHLQSKPATEITYFKADNRKTGGEYITASGNIKKINEYEQKLTMTDGTTIPIEDILSIESNLFI